jgi:4-carboxymuconolactone decarboxylase
MGLSGDQPGRERRLLRLAVAIAQGRWETVREVRRSAPAGEPDRAWRETVLQTHLFCGFPRVVEALARLAEEGGLGGELDSDPDRGLDPAAREARAMDLFRCIYGERADDLREALLERGGVFGEWVIGHAYGRVLTRPGLDAGARETLAVACLTALGPERQLAGHVRGARRCGATRAELEAALDHVADLVDPARLVHARRLVARLGP